MSYGLMVYAVRFDKLTPVFGSGDVMYKGSPNVNKTDGGSGTVKKVG